MPTPEDDYPYKNPTEEEQPKNLKSILTMTTIIASIVVISAVLCLTIVFFILRGKEKKDGQGSVAVIPTVTVTEKVTVTVIPTQTITQPIATVVSSETVTPTVAPTEKIPPSQKGRVFYSLQKDIKNVKEGYLPDRWSGGEKFMVKEDRGKKYVGLFEPKYEESAIINNINYPQNYEIKFKGYMGYLNAFKLSSGSALISIGSGRNCSLNNSDLRLKDSTESKVVSFVFTKKGAILTLAIEGNEPIMVRDTNFKFTDTFSISINTNNRDDSKIYDIVMTDLGE